MTVISKEQLLNWLRNCDKTFTENKQYLTQLDTAIGDADHGNNMHRGFRKVGEQLDGWSKNDIGVIMKSVAMTLISTVGGASGPLYGTFFLQASGKVQGKEALSPDDFEAFLTAGIDGVKMRGKAQAGDKTMVDALEPALIAYSRHKPDITKALDAATDAAEKGAEATIPLIAKKGRASYLGERSKDHMDPGAASVALMLRALSDTANS